MDERMIAEFGDILTIDDDGTGGRFLQRAKQAE